MTATLIPVPLGLCLTVADPERDDLVGIKVWSSATNGFTPAPENLRYSGPGLSYTINGLTGGQTHYVRYALISEIDPDDYETSAQMSAVVGSGTVGPPGAPGTNGERGAGRAYAVGSAWDDAVADAAAIDLYGNLVTGDEVTISNGSTFTLTRRFDGINWVDIGAVIDGNLLVTGSVSSSKIDTRNLTIKNAAGGNRAEIDGATGNLVLAGDIFLSGGDVSSNNAAGYVSIWGGTNKLATGGAFISAFGISSAASPGRLTLSSAQNGSGDQSRLFLNPTSIACYVGNNGTLTLNGSLSVTGSLTLPAQTAKYVFAAPNAANGEPTWRQLVSSDISGLGDAATLNVGTGAGTVATGNHTHTASSVGALPVSGGTLTGVLTVPGVYVGSNLTLFNNGSIRCTALSASGNVVGNSVYSNVDNTYTCGMGSRRWSAVYAGTGAINTSDAREKTPVRPLTQSEIAAAKDLSRGVGAYRFLDAVAKKGDAAREHIGMTVQRAIEIMESHGLNPFGYGFICYDAWESKPAVIGEDGSIIEPEQAAGDRYSFRPDELLMFIARGFEARLSALEQQ